MTAIMPIGFGLENAVTASSTAEKPAAGNFADIIGNGVNALENNVDAASSALASYAVGEDVSPHEVMLAMEQAKMSLQFAVELRNRLVEAYQEVARMQV